jgi:ADP-ribose pyrophosphatase YjhB (NUDIX family)
MNFCPECGSSVSLQAVAGDSRQRYVCSDCGRTHYQNLNILVATYVCVGDEILWIKRGTPPAIGKWAMPGGYMENDETPEAGASRELLEETGIDVPADNMILVSVSSILHMAQTHLVFRCHLDERPATTETEEATEFGWYTDSSLPWSELAFASIEPHVRQTYRWLKNGNYGIRVGFIDENGSQYRNFPLAADELSR